MSKPKGRAIKNTNTNNNTLPFRLLVLFLYDPYPEIKHLDGNVKIVPFSYLRKRFPYVYLNRYPHWLEVLKNSGLLVDYVLTKHEIAVRFPAINISPDAKLGLSIPEIVTQHLDGVK